MAHWHLFAFDCFRAKKCASKLLVWLGHHLLWKKKSYLSNIFYFEVFPYLAGSLTAAALAGWQVGGYQGRGWEPSSPRSTPSDTSRDRSNLALRDTRLVDEETKGELQDETLEERKVEGKGEKNYRNEPLVPRRQVDCR